MMLKRYGVLCSAVLLFTSLESFAGPLPSKDAAMGPKDVYMILNAPTYHVSKREFSGDDSFPRNWRTSERPLRQQKAKFPLISREGLSELHASGSGEFSVAQFKKMTEKLDRKKLWVVDLRQEPHGFMNGMAISWYARYDALNVGKSLSEIEQNERDRLQEVKGQPKAILKTWLRSRSPTVARWVPIPVSVDASSVMTERELMGRSEVNYFRIPGPDHQRPSDEDVDRFLEFAKGIDSTQWVHFHCAAGRGRTTSFLALYDMIRNCGKVSFQDIIERQYLLGGVHLINGTHDDAIRKAWAKERAQFLEKFYQYCKEQGPQFKSTWSEWIRRHL